MVWILYVVFRNIRDPRHLWICALAFGAVAISILGLGTNVEFRLVDMPCLLFGAALLATALPQSSSHLLEGAFAQALFSLLLIGFFYAETRARMQAVGQWATASCGPLIEHRDPFFGSFHACVPFFSVLSAVDVVHATYPSTNVFFGPRMEFLYAREREASPKGLPLWWHPGSSFPKTALPQLVRAWDDNHFDVLVFLHDDRTRIPAAILGIMETKYRKVQTPDATQQLPSSPQPEAQIDVYLRR